MENLNQKIIRINGSSQRLEPTRVVLALKKINCGSGHHLYGIEFQTRDLIKGVNYKTVNFAN